MIKIIERFIRLAIHYYNNYITIVFLRKQIIDDLEADYNGSPIDALNTGYLAAAEEVNPDESVTAVAKASNEM